MATLYSRASELVGDGRGLVGSGKKAESKQWWWSPSTAEGTWVVDGMTVLRAYACDEMWTTSRK